MPRLLSGKFPKFIAVAAAVQISNGLLFLAGLYDGASRWSLGMDLQTAAGWLAIVGGVYALLFASAVSELRESEREGERAHRSAVEIGQTAIDAGWQIKARAERMAEEARQMGLALAEAMEVRMRDEKRRMEELWAEERESLEQAWEERKAAIVAETYAVVLGQMQRDLLVLDEGNARHLRLVQPLKSDEEDQAG